MVSKYYDPKVSMRDPPADPNRQQIKAMKPRYETIINWLIDNPVAPVRDCAEYFGVSTNWMRIIINSDAFRARLAERQDEVFNTCVADLREKTHAAAHEALDLFMTKIPTIEDPMKLLKAVDSLFDKLGYGSKSNVGSPQHYVQQNTTVNVIDPSSLADARGIMDKALAMRSPREPDEIPPPKQELLGSNDPPSPDPVSLSLSKTYDSDPSTATEDSALSTTLRGGETPEPLPDGD